jgi:hypothetical protein
MLYRVHHAWVGFELTACLQWSYSELYMLLSPPRYSWDIVDSGVEYHNPNPFIIALVESEHVRNR